MTAPLNVSVRAASSDDAAARRERENHVVVGFGSEFIVAAAEVLDEGVSLDHDRSFAVGFGASIPWTSHPASWLLMPSRLIPLGRDLTVSWVTSQAELVVRGIAIDARGQPELPGEGLAQ
jgi:hypothetical protein